MSEVYIDSDGAELRVVRYDDSVRFLNAKNQHHRLDGPAVEYANGSKHWYQNGKFHRLDGPACEYADGTKFWLQNDEYHRLDGPALEWEDGHKEWLVEDKPIEPLFLVSYWLERGRCCWFDESTQELRFGDQ